MNTRLVTVIRKDLQLTGGQLAAQASHVGDAWMRNKIIGGKENFTPEEKNWMAQPYITVLSVNTLEDLVNLRAKAQNLKIDFNEWCDILPSKDFNGEFIKYFVGISFGPDDSDKLKQVTGTLPLY